MSDLGEDLARAYEARVVAADVELTPAAIRAVVQALGGGEGRAQVAAGNKEMAGQLGISVRTVQRWQKEGGEARSVARSTPGLADQRAGDRHGAAAGGQRAGVPGAGAGAGAGRGGVPGHGKGLQRGPGATAQHRAAAHRGGRADGGAGRAGGGGHSGGGRGVRGGVAGGLRDGRRGRERDRRGGSIRVAVDAAMRRAYHPLATIAN